MRMHIFQYQHGMLGVSAGFVGRLAFAVNKDADVCDKRSSL